MTVPAAPIPPTRKTRAITEAGDLQPAFSINQETDARTAIARGMKEYLETLEYKAFGGRLLRFKHVFDTWTQAESNAEYPSAACVARGEATYDASKFTPQVDTDAEGFGLVQTCEIKIDLEVGVWATDNKERSFLVAMLEQDLTPAEFRYGTLLELPHYFNARASYEPAGMSYSDTPDDALRRFRKAVVLLHCSMPVLKLKKLPKMKPQVGIRVQPEVGSDFREPGSGITQVFQ